MFAVILQTHGLKGGQSQIYQINTFHFIFIKSTPKIISMWIYREVKNLEVNTYANIVLQSANG